MTLNQKKRSRMRRLQSPKKEKKMAKLKSRKTKSSRKRRKRQVQLGLKEHLKRWRMRIKMVGRKKSQMLNWVKKSLNSEY